MSVLSGKIKSIATETVGPVKQVEVSMDMTKRGLGLIGAQRTSSRLIRHWGYLSLNK